jgi:actin-like ATPase involved in cell morphogenesis
MRGRIAALYTTKDIYNAFSHLGEGEATQNAEEHVGIGVRANTTRVVERREVVSKGAGG